ncbi:WYL domain-containing protein [Mumia sp. zg.B21]|uniref:helix-turn-helix transcriptional regulator n=1 Tax=unclassified Mumia TaxID=2621872 RepID=UPI001C6F2A7E|nr:MULTISPECIES: WYL domain-containing protein [unclassified Mumia]MBW9209785.1 WYL domain-containing protein [Mumia sp. zg.B21]MDD9348678.1 WYL domain-containing protein [Mumia sp.]
MNRTDRLYAIREELRRAGARGRTAEQLAATYEVSVRTIKRDVSALQQGGFPIWARLGRHGGYVVDPDATLPPLNFSEAEVSGLAAAISAHRGEPFDTQARAALAKVLDGMAPPTRLRATALSERVWIDRADDTTGDARSRRAVEEALQERRVLSLRYRDGSGVVTDRRVDPQILASTRGSWYLVAHCRTQDALRWFRLDRIERARLTAARAVDLPVESIGAPPATAAPVADL